MANVTIINKFGKMQGWNSLTANMLGRDLEGIGKIAYDDNVPKSNVYGSGKYPIGREEGNYEATCKISFYKEEIDMLTKQLPPGMRIQDIAAFDMEVHYELNDGTIMKDRIRNIEFQNRGVDVSQGDGTILTEYTPVISHIDWNV